MSKTKEYYHDEISAGVVTQYEPYIFKYTIYFNYGGKPYTVFGDTYEKLTELVSRIVPGVQCLIDDPREVGFAFDCGEWVLPVRLFENVNPIYA